MVITAENIGRYTEVMLEDYSSAVGGFVPSPQDYLAFRAQALNEMRCGSVLEDANVRVRPVTRRQIVSAPFEPETRPKGGPVITPVTAAPEAPVEAPAKPVSGFDLLRGLSDPYNS